MLDLLAPRGESTTAKPRPQTLIPPPSQSYVIVGRGAVTLGAQTKLRSKPTLTFCGAVQTPLLTRLCLSAAFFLYVCPSVSGCRLGASSCHPCLSSTRRRRRGSFSPQCLFPQRPYPNKPAPPVDCAGGSSRVAQRLNRYLQTVGKTKENGKQKIPQQMILPRWRWRHVFTHVAVKR